MHLFIMRHGTAFERSEWDGSDESRPLTDKGKDVTEAVVKALKKRGKFDVAVIWSSPLVRALETAEIAGRVLDLPVKTVKALSCGTTLAKIRHAAAGKPLPDRLLLVGHEPDCGEIIAALVGDADDHYGLSKAGVASLEGEFKTSGMRLLWKLAPSEILT